MNLSLPPPSLPPHKQNVIERQAAALLCSESGRGRGLAFFCCQVLRNPMTKESKQTTEFKEECTTLDKEKKKKARKRKREE